MSGGIACDIRGKLAGRDSCTTTHSTAGSAATDAAGSTTSSAAGSTAGSAATSAPVARQRPDTVDTVAANDRPKPHPDRSKDHTQACNETTTSNTNFPAPTSRQATTQPTRFVHPPRWLPPPPIPTFPHQQAEKSPHNQHVLSFNPKSPHNQHVLSFNPVNPRDEDGGRGGVPLVGTRGFLGATGK